MFDKVQRAARLLRARRAVMGSEGKARAARMEDLKRALKLLELKPKIEREMADLLGMRLRELDALLGKAEAADIVARIEPADEPDMRKVVVYTGEDALTRVGILAKKQDTLVPSLTDEDAAQLLEMLSKIIDPLTAMASTTMTSAAAVAASAVTVATVVAVAASIAVAVAATVARAATIAAAVAASTAVATVVPVATSTAAATVARAATSIVAPVAMIAVAVAASVATAAASAAAVAATVVVAAASVAIATKSSGCIEHKHARLGAFRFEPFSICALRYAGGFRWANVRSGLRDWTN